MELVVRGAIAMIEGHAYRLTNDEAEAVVAALMEYHEDGFVDDVVLACGFLEPGDEQDLDAACGHLYEVMDGAELWTFEEAWARMQAAAEAAADFDRQFGIDPPDPDAPPSFPEPL
jgi:hypothetical protein